MLAVTIHAMEIVLLLLVSLAIYRVYSLYQEHRAMEIEHEVTQSVLSKLMHGDVATNNEYNTKMEALKQAQIFAGIQLLPIKRKFKKFEGEKYAWLREISAYYLIGAILEIAKGRDCTEQSIKELSDLVLKSSLGMPFHQSNTYISQVLYSETDFKHLDTSQVGSEAARLWLSQGHAPQHLGLIEYLNRNAVLA